MPGVGLRRFSMLQKCLYGSGSRFVSSTAAPLSSYPFPSRVLVSTSHDIYSNLALEDWIYDNVVLTAEEGLLMLWRNDPCVVVGRHQNVWTESNVSRCEADGVKVARRRSGGGAVYHDRGNVNLSFFTDRKRYDRKRNLCLISAALNQRWNLRVAVTSRDDLLLNNEYKISGTAAKLGGKIAYHHCTLLVNTNLWNVGKYLHGIEVGVTSKATQSVRASVMNLSQVEPRVNYGNIVELMTSAYCESHNCETSCARIDPTDETLYPGVGDLSSKLQQWDWVYGHSPKFNVNRTVSRQIAGDSVELTVALNIEHGRIMTASIDVIGQKTNQVADLCRRVTDRLKGAKFCAQEVGSVVEAKTVVGEAQITTLWLECLKGVLGEIFECS